MTEAYYECKRQADILKTTLEQNKYDAEKIIADLKERHRSELNALVEENHNL